MSAAPVVEIVYPSQLVGVFLAKALMRRGVQVRRTMTSWDQVRRNWQAPADAMILGFCDTGHLPQVIKSRSLWRLGVLPVTLVDPEEVGVVQLHRLLGLPVVFDDAPLTEVADQVQRVLDGVGWSASALPSVGGEEEVAARRQNAVLRAICGLTDRQLQMGFMLADERGLSAREIAHVLQLSTETVRSHVKSLRAALRAAGLQVGGRREDLVRVMIEGGVVGRGGRLRQPGDYVTHPGDRPGFAEGSALP